jgi:hypothetical protein
MLHAKVAWLVEVCYYEEDSLVPRYRYIVDFEFREQIRTSMTVMWTEDESRIPKVLFERIILRMAIASKVNIGSQQFKGHPMILLGHRKHTISDHLFKNGDKLIERIFSTPAI